MRRIKRDPFNRAFHRGYQAGFEEKSRSSCPHESGQARQHWLTGWREGREDNWNGFNRMAQMQKISNM
ncbi:MAG: ribosome modulation factor [Cellvibrionaceae bacterium]|nr:ribosome modulation factor [Cellvibrionaceae bacterium]MCV6626961.1 ribosome modulation factor [Cellvibrionaceae bacterium]